MNKKIGIIGTLLAVLVLMAVVAVVPAGAAPLNVTTTIGANTSYVNSTVGSAAAGGGNITQVDLSITSSTTKWQGYYGNITGELVLGSNDSYKMFQWNLTSVAGEVLAARDGAMTLSKWTGLTTRNGSQIDAAFLFTSGGVSDNATNTFINTSTAITIAGTPHGASANSAVNTSGTPAWETIALANGAAKDAYVFAGVINNHGIAYDGSTKDFQMIVPVESGTQTYYFYVELT